MPRNDRVSVRELRKNLSALLRRVIDGETVEVTRWGRPVARLGPLGRRLPAGLEQLIEDGRLHPATAGHHDLPPPLQLNLETTASEVLQEQREEAPR